METTWKRKCEVEEPEALSMDIEQFLEEFAALAEGTCALINSLIQPPWVTTNTLLSPSEAISLVKSDMKDLDRVQTSSHDSPPPGGR
mmetsp:Transcript_5875/g.9325  ORF Transcript_5875/g.9325 Transcript_5875/m.9325 type:complete len:87 (-) Transcript_5875:200-460(-)